MRAVDLAAERGHRIAKVYWNRVPRSVADAAFARLQDELPALPFDKSGSVADVPGVVDDARVTTAVDGAAFAAAKAAAMRAHATQIEVAEPYFALSNELAQPLFTTEYYELVRGTAEPGEADLFAGVEEAAA
jgi:N-acetyl-1-D-myo-inositol-2-amino-2-deoxy-alpha-D-glucopyranoside deacetylase